MRILLASVAMLALAACGDSGEGDGDVSEEAAAIAENRPIEGPRSGENIEFDEEGRRWFYKPSTRTALYGTAESEGVISLSCNGAVTGEETLVFQWIEQATADATETLAISNGDNTAEIEVEGIASVLGPDAIWQGDVPQGSEAYMLLAGATSPTTLTLGERSITVPASQQLTAALDACMSDS